MDGHSKHEVLEILIRIRKMLSLDFYFLSRSPFGLKLKIFLAYGHMTYHETLQMTWNIAKLKH